MMPTALPYQPISVDARGGEHPLPDPLPAGIGVLPHKGGRQFGPLQLSILPESGGRFKWSLTTDPMGDLINAETDAPFIKGRVFAPLEAACRDQFPAPRSGDRPRCGR
jgi:hypothetical protein